MTHFFLNRPLGRLAFMLLLALWGLSATPAQAQAWLWAKPSSSTYTSDLNTSRITSSVVDAAGNTYVAGWFAGYLYFGGTPQIYAGFSRSYRDGFLAKYDAAGNAVWLRHLDGNNSSTAGNGAIVQANALCLDASGNVRVAGYFNTQEVDFDGATITNANRGTSDVFIASYSPGGTFLGVNRYGGTGDEEAYALALAPNGYLVFGGEVYNASSGGWNALVGQYSASGLQISTGGGTAFEGVSNLKVDAAGNVFVGGTFSSPTATFGSLTLTNAGGTDGFIARLNSTGQWTQAQAIGGAGNDYVTGLSLNPTTGLVTVVGSFSGATLTAGALSLNNTGAAGTADVFVARLNPATGSWTQASRAGGTGDDAAADAADDADGNTVVVGTYAPTATFGSVTLSSANTFVALFDAAGTWQRAVGGTTSGLGYGARTVALAPDGQVSIGGDLLTDGTFGSFYISGSYSANLPCFVARLSPLAGLPSITSFAPASGPVGTNVVVRGRHFTAATAVRFNGTTAYYRTQGDTVVVATVPPGATTGTISITTPLGTATSTGAFSVVTAPVPANDLCTATNLPVLTCSTPSVSGTTFGSTSTGDPTAGCSSTTFVPTDGGVFYRIIGTGGRITVSTCNAGTSFDTQLNVYTGSCSNLQCVTDNDDATCASNPAASSVSFVSALNTPYLLYVRGWHDQRGPFVLTTTCTGPPAITSFTPTSGPAGTVVTLTGTGLTGAMVVDFNGTLTTVFSVNSAGTQLTVTVPTGAFTGPISVQTSDGTGTSSQSFNSGNYMLNDNAPVTTCSGNVYDSGGPTRDYGSNEDFTKTFTPGTAGQRLQLVFSAFYTEASFDYLYIYDGANTSAPLLFNGSGASLPNTVTATNTAGQLTLRFISDASVTNSGFAARIACVSPPTITSFTPTSGPAGTSVTLTGTNLTGVTSVNFNGVAANFTAVSATSITAVVPATATTGVITVTTSNGPASSTSFKVLPTITSFTPAFGTPRTPATVVTITGTGLLGATAVKFSTGAATQFTVVSATTITATVPATALTGKLSVTTAGGTATSTASFGVAPTVNTLFPTAGAPGSVVLLTGLNYTSAATVALNGTSAAKTYNATTQLTATVPTGATSGPFTVTTGYGTHTAGNYTVTSGTPPTITSFAPTQNVIRGTVVTITGTRFTGATIVRFNNVNTTAITVLSDTQVQAAVPAGATSGKVYVVTANGMAQSAASLTIVQSPTISSLSPTSGAPGSVVLIGGANYSGTTMTAAPVVKFNGVTATSVTVNSATQIAAVVPNGATTGKVTVQTVAGIATSTANFTVLAGPAPTITSLSPTSGLRGSSVVLTGTNFTGVTSVKLGTVACVYTVNSATQLTATVPSTGVTGRIYVTTTTGGMAQSPTYTVLLAPTISSFTPTSGPVGTLVTINGTNLAGITAVRFGGVAATSYSVVSTAKITATVPAGAVTGAVTVTNAAGTATKSTYTVTTPPTITGFSPASGVRGATVTVTGTNFTGATAVKIGAVAATTFAVVSATQLTFTVPTTALTGTVSVTTSQGTGTSSGSFTVILAPTITSFTPSSAGAGTVVTITGTNFTGTTSVKFGTGTATSFTVVSATQITATVPTTATTGKIQVTNPAGTATSAGTFTRTTPRAAGDAAPTEPLVLTLYPNPASAWVEIEVTGLPKAEMPAELLDGLGRVLRTYKVREGVNRLDLAGEKPGLYLVRIGGQAQRLIVE